MEQPQKQELERADYLSAFPPLPAWPTSQPGPKITQPPIGTRRMNVRTEQVIELNYDAEQGKSGEREATVEMSLSANIFYRRCRGLSSPRVPVILHMMLLSGSP